MYELLGIRKLASVTISVLTALVLLLSQPFTETLPERDIYEKAPDTLRVMSFNVYSQRFGEQSKFHRRHLVSQTIAEYYPDSVGLQEATPAWMAWLVSQLPEYAFVGVGRSFGMIIGEFSAVMYLKDKYTPVDAGTFWLSETPEKPSKGWDADVKRICTWVVLENKQTGERYAHMNTHFDNAGVEARANSVSLILEKAAAFDMPVICTGDFNFREGSVPYRAITVHTLADVKMLAPDTMHHATFNGFAVPENHDRIIDFIFVNERVTPLVYRVITEGIDGRFVSDHYPLYADVLLN